ncbi:MAG: peptide ABC transporter substrate-binding protein [Verrucomicrobia bacterium]|nr:peptide ABC transporter substrate-binding protein [Verrucomicrobiota bacterium]
MSSVYSVGLQPGTTSSRAALLLALLGLLSVFTSACARRESTTAAADRTQTLHVGIGGEPSELDPHLINAPPDFRAVFAFFEGLLTHDPVTLGPRPAVAERWEMSADGLTYTFHLRANARWSNGDPLTSADFLYSFRRALSPALGSQYTLLYNPVRGAADYAAGKLTDFNQVGFAAPDPQTLVVTLGRPTPYFLSLVTGNPVWFPVHRATIERYGRIDQRGTAWTRPDRIVSNGPFVLKEWRPLQRLVGEKSLTYWNAAPVHARCSRHPPPHLPRREIPPAHPHPTAHRQFHQRQHRPPRPGRRPCAPRPLPRP